MKSIVRHSQISKIAIDARPKPKPKPKAVLIKQTAVSPRSKAAGDTELYRLKAFGGLRRALNLDGCEI